MTTDTIFAYASDHGLSEAVKRALRPIECQWPRSGYTSRKSFEPWPAGAYFWRHVGDTEWQAIPGRTWDAERMEGVVNA